MPVKDGEELDESLRELDDAVKALTRARDALLHARSGHTVDVLSAVAARPGVTVRELAERMGIPETALITFAETAGALMGDKELDSATARRAALLAVAGQVWEDELGPLLDSSEVRGLLGGVSRQRVDELLRGHRLIGLRDSAGRRRFPAFQFLDGGPVPALVQAFWTVADGALSDWTAAAWCVAPDDSLRGLSPAEWARGGNDAARLAQIAEQDRSRLAR
jgi:hypothetical protein